LKLVFVTQQVDPAHPALGATTAKVGALAELVDEVVVLADFVVPSGLPANVRARSFRAPFRPGRGLRFEAVLGRELPGLRGGAVVAHMCPIYAVLAAPLARPLGIPVVLWFAHWRPSGLLRVAERLASAVVTVERRSFPIPSRKLHAIGHGIEVGDFDCSTRVANGPLRLLALGRYSPAKGLEVALRALTAVDARLTVHGPALTEEEREHRHELEQLVEELGLADRVRLGDPVPREQVPSLFSQVDALVNNMRAGAPDKVVYEAAASCLPVLASNPVFSDLLEPGLRFAADAPDELAARLRAFGQLDPDLRAELGRRLRQRVIEGHTVQGWAEGVLQAAGVR
jgi:glycosyltransferase involved in cell wall biosynthesis